MTVFPVVIHLFLTQSDFLTFEVQRKMEKSNVRISNYMPIILWIIQNCHANISQICNIHNDIFLSSCSQKVRGNIFFGSFCYVRRLKLFMIKHF
jgi:hypothetical protein